MTMLQVSQVEKFIEQLKQVVKNCDSTHYFAFAQVQNWNNAALICQQLESKYVLRRRDSTVYCSLDSDKTLELRLIKAETYDDRYIVYGRNFNFALLDEKLEDQLRNAMISRIRREVQGIWTYNSKEEIRNDT